MAYDLGFNNSDPTPQYVNEAIAAMDARFDLVMITDRFEESIILMRDLLCMSEEDVIYLGTRILIDKNLIWRRSLVEKENIVFVAQLSLYACPFVIYSQRSVVGLSGTHMIMTRLSTKSDSTALKVRRETQSTELTQDEGLRINTIFRLKNSQKHRTGK